jgi:3-hydroxyanthranilate 3,4-dioxygenase
MAIAKPFNLAKWIEDNRQLLKPPVGNKNLYIDSGDYIVMIVAGPNARKDYHYNETEELFYQLEGSIKVIIQEDGIRKEMETPAICICIQQSSTFSCSFEGSIGLVIERIVLLRAMLMDYCGSVITVTINCMMFDELNNIEKISCLILSISTIQSTYALVIPVAL